MLNDIFNILLPEINLVIFILILITLSLILSPRQYKFARIITIIGIAISTVLLTTVQTEPQYFGFYNSVMSDSYTLLFDFIILICGFLTALITKKLVTKIKRNAYSFYAIFLAGILGAISVVSANDFLTLLVSIELLSFSSYFLISATKDYYSKEAAFKYLITSALSTGVYLFGVSYMYGITGSINISSIYETIFSQEPTIMYSISAILIVLGLISKLAIFPFANWVIDVFKGTESSIIAYISTIPELALFGIICRLLVFPLSNSFELTFTIAIISLLTALWANTYAIREKNVKIILACSAAANSSYALFAASLVSVYNLSTVIFYLICYVIMNIGAFCFLNIYGDEKTMEIDAFKGLFHNNHGLVGAYAISIVGLSGIPITAGFISKIYLFTAIANSGLMFLPFLLALLLLTVIALFYYLKILLPLFDKEYTQEVIFNNILFSQKFVLTICALFIIIIGFYPEKLIELCRFIAYNI